MTGGVDPRLPILIGVGQLSQRVDRGAPALEPARLMAEALARAELDAATPGLLARADSIRVVNELSWRYGDPGALVAGLVRAHPRETTYGVVGGNEVQRTVNQTALDIQRGRADLVLLTGAEAWRTVTRSRREGATLDWTTQPAGTAPTRTLGDDRPLSAPEEIARGLRLPVQFYPMVEIALRAAAHRDPDKHRTHIAELWSRFSDVAATNPHAWIQQSFTAGELATATPDNRMIGYPYTKRLNSNNAVEQGAGLIMCSVKKARDLGVPTDRWVFLHAGSDAHDHPFLSNRAELHASPAMRIAGRGALDLAGVSVDDVDHLDLYSCFPSAVQVAARELNVDLGRPLTVTGGMTFAGGPWNNYGMHAVATMADVLREDPGSIGLCSGNGGFLTKHAFGLYSTDPPLAGRYRHTNPQSEVDELPRRELVTSVTGPVEVETYSVMHDRAGEPAEAIVALLTPEGNRAWGTSTDRDLLDELVANEHVGSAAQVEPDGTVHLA